MKTEKGKLLKDLTVSCNDKYWLGEKEEER